MLKRTLFIFLAIFLFVCFSEFITKVGIAIFFKQPLAFFYGIDDSIGVTVQNKKVTFQRFTEPKPQIIQEEKEVVTLGQEKITIATFGGSTTYGYNCGDDCSSWPEELEKELESRDVENKFSYEVVNFGRDGSNSDYAADKALTNLPHRKVDFILWANFINEMDVLDEGLKRNSLALSDEYEDVLNIIQNESPFFMRRIKHFFYRLDLTFHKYFLSYTLFRHSLYYIKWWLSERGEMSESEVDRREPDIFSDQSKMHRPIRMAVENYRLNFLDVLAFSKKRGITLIIVRLPMDTKYFPEGLDQETIRRKKNFRVWFLGAFDRLQLELSKKHGVPFLDLQKEYDQLGDLKEHFCDAWHGTLKGHIVTGRLSADFMEKLF